MKIDRINNVLSDLATKDLDIGTIKEIIDSVLNDVVDEVVITKGAMILDGYDEEDSCIHYMNGLIKELSNLDKKINK